MAIRPIEIMKGSILLHEGKVKRVKAIGDFILFEGTKQWIGGSLVNGEPLNIDWMKRLPFVCHSELLYTKDYPLNNDEYRRIYVECYNGTWWVGCPSIGPCGVVRVASVQYMHQLQNCLFALTGEHLKVPKTS